MHLLLEPWAESVLTLRSCSTGINRFDHNRFELIQSTFLNTLPIVNYWHAVTPWNSPYASYIIQHYHAKAFSTVSTWLKPVENVDQPDLLKTIFPQYNTKIPTGPNKKWFISTNRTQPKSLTLQSYSFATNFNLHFNFFDFFPQERWCLKYEMVQLRKFLKCTELLITIFAQQAKWN